MGNNNQKESHKKRRPSPSSSRSNRSTSGTDLFTPYQRLCLKETWRKMPKTGRSGFGHTCLQLAFEEPKLKEVFQHVEVIEGVFSYSKNGNEFQQHSALILKLVDSAVANVDNLSEKFQSNVEEIGARHSQYGTYGFRAEFWDVIGNAVLEAALPHCRGKCAMDKRRAWAVLASFLADRLRAGYESSIRRKSLQLDTQIKATRDMSNAGGIKREDLSSIEESPLGSLNDVAGSRRNSRNSVKGRRKSNDATNAHSARRDQPSEALKTVAEQSIENILEPPAQDGRNEGSISCGEETPDLRRKAMGRMSLRGLERAKKFRQRRAWRRSTTAGVIESSDGGSSISTAHLLISTDQSTTGFSADSQQG